MMRRAKDLKGKVILISWFVFMSNVSSRIKWTASGKYFIKRRDRNCNVFPSFDFFMHPVEGWSDAYWQGILLSSLLRQKEGRKEENLFSCETFLHAQSENKENEKFKAGWRKIEWKLNEGIETFSRQSQNFILSCLKGSTLLLLVGNLWFIWNMRRIKMWFFVFPTIRSKSTWSEVSSVWQSLMDFHLSLDESIGALEE